MSLGNGSKLASLGVGHFGCLSNVIIVPDLNTSLVSTPKLVTENNFSVIHIGRHAYVVDDNALANQLRDYFRKHTRNIVAKATINKFDGLYHFKHIEDFLRRRFSPADQA